MKDRELEKMKLDDLWDLHQRLIDVLDRKLETEKRSFKTSSTKPGRSSADLPRTSLNACLTPRLSPNIEIRTIRQRHGQAGQDPAWMTEMIADGRSLDGFRIQ